MFWILNSRLLSYSSLSTKACPFSHSSDTYGGREGFPNREEWTGVYRTILYHVRVSSLRTAESIASTAFFRAYKVSKLAGPCELYVSLNASEDGTVCRRIALHSLQIWSEIEMRIDLLGYNLLSLTTLSFVGALPTQQGLKVISAFDLQTGEITQTASRVERLQVRGVDDSRNWPGHATDTSVHRVITEHHWKGVQVVNQHPVGKYHIPLANERIDDVPMHKRRK